VAGIRSGRISDALPISPIVCQFILHVDRFSPSKLSCKEVTMITSPAKSRPSSIISNRQEDDDPPLARPWWFHNSALSLDDPLASLPKAALEEGAWKAFRERDCMALEEQWSKLPDRIKRQEEHLADETGVVDELGNHIKRVTTEEKDREEVDDVSKDEMKVIVGVERLHHVDVTTLKFFILLFELIKAWTHLLASVEFISGLCLGDSFHLVLRRQLHPRRS
jgi:hypothetical protein